MFVNLIFYILSPVENSQGTNTSTFANRQEKPDWDRKCYCHFKLILGPAKKSAYNVLMGKKNNINHNTIE